MADNLCLVTHIVPVDALPGIVNGRNPPAVAYIDTEDDPVYSEHPPENVTLGSEWTASVIDTIFSSPIGNSSAVFLFYDENGGYWDPVVPPTEPPLGVGFRVPLLVLSRYSGGGRLVDVALDPASLLQFVEQNWGLPSLTDRIASSPSADVLFRFSSTMAPSPILPTPIELNASAPTAAPPVRIPTAEPGLLGQAVTFVAIRLEEFHAISRSPGDP